MCLPDCLHMCHVCAVRMRESEPLELELLVVVLCSAQCGCWEPNLDPLEERYKLPTTFLVSSTFLYSRIESHCVTHPSAHRHLGWFCVLLVIVNSVVITTGVQHLRGILTWVPFDPQSGKTGSHGSSDFSLWRSLLADAHRGYTSLHPPSECRNSFPPTSMPVFAVISPLQ